VDPNVKTAYAHTWNVSLERQITKSILVAAEYSGSEGVDLYSIAYPNRVGFGNSILGIPCTATPDDPSNPQGDCTAKIRSTQYGKIGYRGNQGFSNYNALNTRVVLSNVANSGVTMLVNYTWSHAIDNLSSTFFEAGTQNIYGNANITVNNGNFVQGILDPFHPNLDRGNAEFDARQRLTISGVWDIPFKKTGVANLFLGGWSLAPIFSARTGSPFSIFDSTFAANYAPRAFFNGPVPNHGSSNPQAVGAPNTYSYISFTNSQIDHYINRQFGASDVGAFPGNMSGRDAFTSPGFWNLDVGLYKNTKITERMTLQLRAETFNIFNHANLYVVGASADLGAQNYITACRGCTGSTYDRRNLQLAAKIIF
jgi:hypothetical protein